MKLMVVLTSRSKSHQKVKEFSKSLKNLKGLKSCKGHWFGGTFTKAPILCQIRYKEFELLLEFGQFFELFLMSPGALSILRLE